MLILLPHKKCNELEDRFLLVTINDGELDKEFNINKNDHKTNILVKILIFCDIIAAFPHFKYWFIA